jgi:nucleotide-binding universal stress UspA family protein
MPPSTDLSNTYSAHRIVVGVDGSDSALSALDWSAAQAALTNASLEVVTVVESGHLFRHSDQARETVQELLDEVTLRAEKTPGSSTVSSKLIDGIPASTLIDESRDADLLVVGSRGRGGFAELLLGSVGRKCLHRAHCPMVVVHGRGRISETDSDRPRRDDEPPSEPQGLPSGIGPSMAGAHAHRIVVGIDGSPSSIAAAHWAARQAELTGAVLEVLMTWEWPATYGWAPGASGYDPAHDCGVVMDGALATLQNDYPGLAIDGVIVEGHPAHQLKQASDGADMLVVGSRGHGEFADVLLGSVSEYCVTNVACPVVVVRDRSIIPDARA